MTLRPRLTLLAALISTAGMANTEVASGPNLGFTGPQLSDDGRRAVMHRLRAVDGVAPCATSSHGLVVMDLEASCNHDVLRELKIDGAADPAISSDGTVFYWMKDGSDFEFWEVPADFSGGPSAVVTDTSAAYVRWLDATRDGDHIVYARKESPDFEIHRYTRGTGGWTLDTVDSIGGPLELNAQHAMSDDGTVFYAREGGTFPVNFDIWKRSLSDTAPVRITNTSVDETNVAVAGDATKLAYVRNDAGVDNVYVRTGTSWGTATALTTNTSSGIEIIDVDISGDGAWILFVSNGDFGSHNSDGSWELFRTSDGSSFDQLTDLPFGHGMIGLVNGITANVDGSSVMFSTGLYATTNFGVGPCTADEYHSFKVGYTAFEASNASHDAADFTVAPPFEVLSDAGMGLGCTHSSTTHHVTCSLAPAVSAEGDRRVLFVPTFTIDYDTCPTVVAKPPVKELTVVAQHVATESWSQALSTTCGEATVSFHLAVIGPDVTVADRVAASAFIVISSP